MTILRTVLPAFLSVVAGVGLAGCSAADEPPASQGSEDNFSMGILGSKGDTCSSNWGCGSDLVCRPTQPGAKDSTCQYVGEVGEACDEDKDCMGGDPSAAHKAGTGGCKKPTTGDATARANMVCWRTGTSGM